MTQRNSGAINAVVVFVFGMGHAIACHAASYDAAADFTTASNAGTWTYGSKESAHATLQLFDLHTASDFVFGSSSTVSGWNAGDVQPTGGNPYYPFAIKNVGATDATVLNNEGPGSNITLPVGQIALHASPARLSALRFTAPETATYSISGAFTRLEFSPIQHTQEIMVVSGANDLFDQLITGNLNAASFAVASLPLVAGQTVDFQVASNPEFYGGTMQINVAIAVVPEPEAAMFLAAFGAVLLRPRHQRP